MTKNKLHLGVALATLTMAAALVSPQAAAKHKVAKHKAAAHAAYVAPSKIDLLEAQLRATQDEVAGLRAQVNSTAPVTAVDSQKVQELDARMASVETKEAKHKEHHKDNMVFFRGGYARADDQRGTGTLNGNFSNQDLLAGITTRPGQDAWYFGAGFDWGINNDLFGLMDKTQVLAELNLEYKQYAGSNMQSGLVSNVHSLPSKVTVNQLNISAAPKVKFLKGSAFRPWLIPVGFDLTIISPPSGAVTVLNPGMVFGLGADYKVWKDIYLGTDVRYHLAPGSIDGVNTNGVTAGGYVGLGF